MTELHNSFDEANIDVDFGLASTWTETIPERMRWLRENAPVYWSEKTGAYIISRYQDVAHISKNSELFCSGEGILPGRLTTKIGLIDEDEPRHGEMRGLINRGFTPRMVRKWEDVFKKITDEAIDTVAAKGECDFVEDIAVPLPLILIAEMIGIRREDRERFHHWSDAMISAQGNLDDPEIVAAAGKAAMEYMTYVTEVIEDRRREPKDDLISILVRAKDEGLLIEYESQESDEETLNEAGFDRDEHHRSMNNDELIKLSIVLMVAGNETTRNGLSGSMQLLIDHPETRQRLIDDPALIPAAIEEMLRLTSPVLSFQRTATQNTEIRGVPIKQGERVLMIYGSANRDAEEFENPDRFDIDRNPHHLAFGIGTHFCMGANLARMELRVALAELLRRIPDMRYATGGPEFGESALVRCVKHLHVKFTPEQLG
ncbi:MAG: cytochrome P450 [bacterium]|nr:cytochrome P450 [Deltaproteobacteria bacterium]MCP4907861.1 cytochrome P450 [bacterium]